jgi:CRISPR/Cas system-associated exonuclease Cas4 (RecB family)
MASGEGVVGAEFWYPGYRPGQQNSVTVRRFDMKRLPEVLDAMRRVQAGVLAEEWPTITGEQCDRCPVRIVCPEWPEGREAYS